MARRHGGDLIVAPVLLVVATNRRRSDRPPGSLLEAVLLLTALIGMSILAFSQETALFYLLFPFLIWGALRFWQPGAAVRPAWWPPGPPPTSRAGARGPGRT